jgi:hypothetical protein
MQAAQVNYMICVDTSRISTFMSRIFVFSHDCPRLSATNLDDTKLNFFCPLATGIPVHRPRSSKHAHTQHEQLRAATAHALGTQALGTSQMQSIAKYGGVIVSNSTYG